MVKKVRGIAISAGTTIAFLALLAFAAQRTNIGDTLQQALRGFGSNVGRGITAPFTGLVEGVNIGGQDLFGSAVEASEAFQRGLTGGSLFSEILGGDSAQSDPKASIEDLASRLKESFNPQEAPQLARIAQQTGNFDDFITRIGNIVNPEPSSPTVGLYQITFKNGKKSGVLPLSQAAIDVQRNLGNTVTRVN